VAKREVSEEAVAGILVLLALALAVAAGLLGFFLGRHTKHSSVGATTSATVASPTIDPTVASGGHLFVQFACAQCHGMQGRGGVSPDVPALTTVANTLRPSELRSIINHGLGASSNPTKPFMPVWGQVISQTQVSDLVDYIRAGLPNVPTATPPAVPTNQGASVEGAVLYVKYGCINCHGPNGLGGVPNPLSPDKRIPPLSGQAFRQQFNTDQKIIAVIQSGSVIGKAPIVSMPHWGGIIPQPKLDALVAYLKTLKVAPTANG
jgi:mono/diheme cytochrome c family protein